MLEDVLFDDKPKVTTKEAANMLGVTEATIYRYEKEGKLSSVYKDNWRKDGTKMFYEEEVLRIVQTLRKPGFTIQDIADKAGVSHSTVSKWIQAGTLHANKTIYNGRNTYFISEQEAERILKILPSLITQRSVKRKLSATVEGKKVFLYQSFYHETTHEQARIMSLDNNTGKVITEREEMFPLEELFSRGFHSTYIIERKRHSTKRGQAQFRFRKPQFIQAAAYTIIEWLYQFGGAANVKIEEKGQMIHVEVKPLTLEIDVREHQAEIEFLAKHIEEGTISVRNNSVYIESDIEPVSFYVERTMKQRMKEEAEKEKMGLESWIKKIIVSYLQNKTE